ncbi:MAG TPA: hypothetical protein VNQ79_13945 [Blastocatellia bacterium]|nr:hypothetical protein [Blastocatellia bacterium]
MKIGFDAAGNPEQVMDTLAQPRAGDAFGALMIVRLGQQWVWTSEYSVASNNLNRLSAESARRSGRAWRTNLTGMWRGFNVNATFRDVSPNFASPASASLAQSGTSDRRGVDAAVSRDTRLGSFNLTYQFLESDFRLTDKAHLALHNFNFNWTKNLTRSTMLTIGGNETRTLTANRDNPLITEGRADQRRIGFTTSITQTVKTLMLTVGGSRNWFRDRLNDKAGNIVSALTLSGVWNARTWFQLNSNVSLNWTAGEKFSVGGSRIITVYLQPNFIWPRAGITVTPLITLNQMTNLLGSGVLTADTLMTQSGGRVSWQLPGRLRFSTFSFEGSLTRTRDGLHGTTILTPRLLFLWTLVRAGNRTE